MRRAAVRFWLGLVVATNAGCSVSLPDPSSLEGAGPASDEFITRSGTQLMVAGQPFRFAGGNMSWLILDEVGDGTHPSTRRIDEALDEARAMGHTAARSWAGTFGCAACVEPALGQFSDEGLSSLDYALKAARDRGLRLVLSVVDNYSFPPWGGKPTFVAWRGVTEADFFSDPTVIQDVKDYITFVAGHVNPHTGLAYRDDPTIMAWATGSELWCETCADNQWDGSWTRVIADHLKSVAPRQLIIDGHASDPECHAGCLHEPSMDLASIDIVEDHFNALYVDRLRSDAATVQAHGKVYLIGRFFWADTSGDPLASFLTAVEESVTAGDFFWFLQAHDDAGGVPTTGRDPLLYPGTDAAMTEAGELLAAHAARMRAP